MTNIWADSYKEIRQPFFETESLEEERAKRDYDDDGKVESGAKEYRGAVHNAIQKKKGGKPDGQDTSSVKEDIEQVDEAQVANRDPEKYEREQAKKSAPVRGERTPMPPRGDRRREDFERWYRANVREDVEQVDEAQDATPPKGQSKYGRKAPAGYMQTRKPTLQQMSSREKQAWKNRGIGEDIETLAEVDSCGSSADKKVDVMKGGKKNKVVINPPIREEVEEWVNELVEDGYDLSKFTMSEMVDIYESVELEEQMPARGDAETVNATDSTQLNAKRRMAQAQIRADLARVQYQKAAMTKESVDSIVEYLSQRADAFENLEEGVFDPKKSKLRPASERSQRTMTDKQRTAAKKEAARTAEIHSKGETVLAGMRPQGKKGKVKTTPAAKSPAPAANRTVKGRYDKLAKAASSVLKDIKK